jgi:peptide/nickel transport system ATP-binding protein
MTATGQAAGTASTTQTRLQVDDLSVRFHTDDGDICAVDGLSFDLGAREVLALVGESGCGKSVTATAILGLLPDAAEMTSGRIVLDGTDLAGLSRSQLRALRGSKIGMVFQEPMTSLNPVFTVGRQIGEVLTRHLGHRKRQAREVAVELLDRVGIPAPRQRISEYPHQLSGGMRQRVMIAMAIACNPSVLIADEPTTALDVTIQAGILDIMRSLRSDLGTSIILITHDLGVVADIADRVVIMYAGRKIEQAPVEQLFSQPQHPYTMGLLGAVPRPGMAAMMHGADRRLAEIPGRVPVMTAPASDCSFHPRCPRASDRCRSLRPELEGRGHDHRVACFYPGEEGGAQ